jgi:uncharacterized protein (DUF433 family)
VSTGQTGLVTVEQLALIVIDPSVLHGQAYLECSRVPVSVVLDCVAAGMSEAAIVQEYPSLDVARVRAAAAYGALLARGEL